MTKPGKVLRSTLFAVAVVTAVAAGPDRASAAPMRPSEPVAPATARPGGGERAKAKPGKAKTKSAASSVPRKTRGKKHARRNTKGRSRGVQAGAGKAKARSKAGAVAALAVSERTVASKDARRRPGERPLPVEFLDARIENVYTRLMARPPRIAGTIEAPVEIETDAKKQPFLSAVYSRNLVEASTQTELLADKLVMARVLEKALEGEARQWLPKTLGLKEFLQRHGLVDGAGRVTASGDAIEKALYEEFPAGFVVRPAVGVAPRETKKGLVPEGDEFIVALLGGRSPYYQPRHFRRPVRSSVLGDVASGEAVILQDDVILRADVKKKLKKLSYREIRVHTYENKVVEGAAPVRWVSKERVDEREIADAEGFVGRMLSRLPPRLVERQAWGVDVALFDNGEMTVTEIITNRGRRIQWSSYLEQPRVLGAYARHFERHAGVRFDGMAGTLIRNNLGNYMPYWQTRIEKARPGWSKIVSYLPPLP